VKLHIEVLYSEEMKRSNNNNHTGGGIEGPCNLVGMDRGVLRELAVSCGEKPFRGEQLFGWIYRRRVDSIDEMPNLPASFRSELKRRCVFQLPRIADKQVSGADGTIKFLFALADDLKIESVLIPPGNGSEIASDMRRLTLCISTQVGCPAGCAFCATGPMGFFRNCTVGEMVGQVLVAQRHASRRISNVVCMGMGEPMLNYDNVMQAIDLLGDDEGIGISPRRITVSTVGYPARIKQMADEKRRAKLAISLHSMDDTFRTSIIPINRKHGVGELIEAAKYYYRKTRQRVTFEYIFFEGLNDSERDIRALKKLSGKAACKLNIIPFHPIYLPDGSALKNTFKPPDPDALRAFMTRLRAECDFPVMLRSSSGLDIDGACGQLAVTEKAGSAKI
jgi:23S rRNA (adenine2503-C2)-methyltransferase